MLFNMAGKMDAPSFYQPNPTCILPGGWGCSKEATALNAAMGGSDFYMLVSRPTLGESKWQPKGQRRAGSTPGRDVVL